jgi:oligopeptide/dipeptide ABC transporter ATP-binding protein
VRGSKAPLRAVNGVSLQIAAGTTFGLIGESGSGKSTVARAITRLAPIEHGEVALDGVRLDALKGRALRNARRRVQMVFQDPHESLDPRMDVRQSIGEPLQIVGGRSAEAIDRRVSELLELVELHPTLGDRRPHQLSGGQKQRVNIARALAPHPELVICDEAVSALDLSVQAGVLNLLLGLQRELGLAYLFISHDLGVVAHVSDRIGVMYLGRLVEIASTPALVSQPRHPYTEALLAAEPQAVPSAYRAARAVSLQGDIPSPLAPPSGCHFRTRCAYAAERCATEDPPLREVGGSLVACHFADSLELRGKRAGVGTAVNAPRPAPWRNHAP